MHQERRRSLAAFGDQFVDGDVTQSETLSEFPKSRPPGCAGTPLTIGAREQYVTHPLIERKTLGLGFSGECLFDIRREVKRDIHLGIFTFQDNSTRAPRGFATSGQAKSAHQYPATLPGPQREYVSPNPPVPLLMPVYSVLAVLLCKNDRSQESCENLLTHTSHRASYLQPIFTRPRPLGDTPHPLQ